MKLIAYTFIFILSLFTYCKKEKDIISTHTIKGMVYNTCTDSGIANVVVYLKDGLGLDIAALSDGNGNFEFSSVKIHSSSKYNYALYIPSKSGIGATTPNYAGFNGTTLSFNANEADVFFKPRVTPKYLFFCIDFVNNVNIPASDSIKLYYYQKVFHKNLPELPYDGSVDKAGIFDPGCGSNYPMGLWNIVIDKWKNNTHTTVYDSIYIDWASSKTYTVNW